MSLPCIPTNYAAAVDPPAFGTITWTHGAGAETVVHEFSINGQPFELLDSAPSTDQTMDHSLPYPEPTPGGNATLEVKLRAKSVNADGESEYTPIVTVTTTEYVP